MAPTPVGRPLGPQARRSSRSGRDIPASTSTSNKVLRRNCQDLTGAGWLQGERKSHGNLVEKSQETMGESETMGDFETH